MVKGVDYMSILDELYYGNINISERDVKVYVFQIIFQNSIFNFQLIFPHTNPGLSGSYSLALVQKKYSDAVS